MRKTTVGIALLFASFLVWGVTFLAAQADSTKPALDLPVSYAATAFGQAGTVAGKSFGVTVHVTAWSSDSDVQTLAATLKSKGPDGLAKALFDDKEIGRVSPTGSTGSDFKVARIHPNGQGGYRIVLVTDRPISLPEQRNNTRSTDYPFGIVTLDVDKDGKGTGSLAPICKISFNKQGELEVEHYGQKPLRLANVRMDK
ncbi:MAG: hypothetical protein ABR902_16875 [Candidatus Korobacteraceae bacterium]|jgi:hypothetical protein